LMIFVRLYSPPAFVCAHHQVVTVPPPPPPVPHLDRAEVENKLFIKQPSRKP